MFARRECPSCNRTFFKYQKDIYKAHREEHKKQRQEERRLNKEEEKAFKKAARLEKAQLRKSLPTSNKDSSMPKSKRRRTADPTNSSSQQLSQGTDNISLSGSAPGISSGLKKRWISRKEKLELYKKHRYLEETHYSRYSRSSAFQLQLDQLRLDGVLKAVSKEVHAMELENVTDKYEEEEDEDGIVISTYLQTDEEYEEERRRMKEELEREEEQRKERIRLEQQEREEEFKRRKAAGLIPEKKVERERPAWITSGQETYGSKPEVSRAGSPMPSPICWIDREEGKAKDEAKALHQAGIISQDLAEITVKAVMKIFPSTCKFIFFKDEMDNISKMLSEYRYEMLKSEKFRSHWEDKKTREQRVLRSFQRAMNSAMEDQYCVRKNNFANVIKKKYERCGLYLDFVDEAMSKLRISISPDGKTIVYWLKSYKEEWDDVQLLIEEKWTTRGREAKNSLVKIVAPHEPEFFISKRILRRDDEVDRALKRVETKMNQIVINLTNVISSNCMDNFVFYYQVLKEMGGTYEPLYYFLIEDLNSPTTEQSILDNLNQQH